jgi:peroxiredoxin
MRVNYRTVIGTDLIAQQYGGVDALPTSFIIDREGKIASTHIGLVRKSDYEKDIQELLAIP